MADPKLHPTEGESLTKEDSFDEEEGQDRLSAMPRARKNLSDMTGMAVPSDVLAALARQQVENQDLPAPVPRRRDRRAVSDLVAMMAIKDEETKKKTTRTRQKSTSDLVTKFAYAPQLMYDDLR